MCQLLLTLPFIYQENIKASEWLSSTLYSLFSVLNSEIISLCMRQETAKAYN